MKRRTPKLAVHRETLRALANVNLSRIVVGADSGINCPIAQALPATAVACPNTH
jgi:hypothetical protein